MGRQVVFFPDLERDLRSLRLLNQAYSENYSLAASQPMPVELQPQKNLINGRWLTR